MGASGHVFAHIPNGENGPVANRDVAIRISSGPKFRFFSAAILVSALVVASLTRA
jgi:hypothetical protein